MSSECRWCVHRTGGGLSSSDALVDTFDNSYSSPQQVSLLPLAILTSSLKEFSLVRAEGTTPTVFHLSVSNPGGVNVGTICSTK